MLASVSSGLLLYYAHATLCLLLAVGLAWQAWRSAPGPRRLGRLLAGLLAATALWLSAYPPEHTVETDGAGAAILLTPGYSVDTVRALRRRLGPVPLLRYRPIAQSGGDTLALNSLPALTERLAELRQLHVLGNGLPVADVAALPPNLQLVPHPAVAGPRFVSALWNERLALGETLRLEGRFLGSGTQPVWVRLSVAGRLQDSVQLPAAGGAFTLRGQPRYAGRQLARLDARQGRAHLATEPVPLQVQPARRLRVLLLVGSPSFELNLLKNHLASRGHQVALRLRLSRGLLQTEAQNQPAADVTSLTPAAWRRYDAVVTDADGLNGLTPAEASHLAAATADGLGVLLVGATDLPRALPGRSDFALQARPVSLAEQPQLIRWPEGSATAPLPALLRPTPNTRPLVTGPAAAIAAASRRTGWGTVLVATPATTFQWLLSGATARYDSYWRALLGAVARPLEPATRWSTPRWPRPDEPLTVQLTTARPLPRAAAITVTPAQGPATPLALRQHPAQNGTWQGTYWPAGAGWHQATAPGQDTAAFYVFAPSDWQGPLQAQQLSAVQRSVDAFSGSGRSSHEEPWLPAGWFFAFFVGATGWLWLDEKR
ncbi:hypothetical protein LJ737_01505 [Hymenobacter sp. 15J16-1T3B]|uniref:hypothetical protein n=1 Tax=Hymenobacter sp. 15J16-1T3B TaxID=2886941 RepID=UPI001D11CFC8|nr:hypothetical protein [Hymenobacter sp. 15J16-1T3B]MCC3155894.1 hypothetical protein [Hymenobacter sp. 15J16-1T3B]